MPLFHLQGFVTLFPESLCSVLVFVTQLSRASRQACVCSGGMWGCGHPGATGHSV